jgi:hypothetical protein
MTRSDLPLRKLSQGKVRDVYDVDTDRLLLVATDRVSAFDVVMRGGTVQGPSVEPDERVVVQATRGRREPSHDLGKH